MKPNREERWETCKKYLRAHPTLDAARAAAKRDGVSFATAVWLTAMSKALAAGEFPGTGGLPVKR